MSDQRYVEIPGNATHELPPLLVHSALSADGATRREVMDRAATMVDIEDLISTELQNDDVEQRKFDLALHLADRYFGLLNHWQWGNSILEWIRQCEITFSTREVLRPLLQPDIWPHAGRASFVTLLVAKRVPVENIGVERAVGLRLTFRQPPPIDCFSDQFLFFLNSPVADSAYRSWAGLVKEAPALLPPSRFHFEVLNMDRN